MTQTVLFSIQKANVRLHVSAKIKHDGYVNTSYYKYDARAQQYDKLYKISNDIIVDNIRIIHMMHTMHTPLISTSARQAMAEQGVCRALSEQPPSSHSAIARQVLVGISGV